MEKELVETRQVLSTAAVTESDADADPAVSGRVGTKMTVITSRESVHTGVPILNRVRLRSIPSIADSVLVVALTTIRPECQPLPKGDPIRSFADVLMAIYRRSGPDLKRSAR